MKSIEITSPRKIRIFQQDMPTRKEGEALLKVIYGGICGSDLSLYRGTMDSYASFPRIPGHEIAAQIVEIDENDMGLKEGDIVTMNPYFNCGKCYSCRRGFVNCCQNNQTMGLARDGGFSEYITMPVERLYDSRGLDPRLLVLIEPMCISYHAVKRGRVKAGERVLVMGAGTIGMGAMLTAKMLGAEVYVYDVIESKLDIAMDMGADGVIRDSSGKTFEEMTGEITGGDGFDACIEAVGQPSAMQSCIEAAAYRGRIVQAGIPHKPLELVFDIIEKKELEIIGSRNAMKEDFEELIDMANAGKINLEPMITGVYDADDAAKAFDRMDNNIGLNLKTIIKF